MRSVHRSEVNGRERGGGNVLKELTRYNTGLASQDLQNQIANINQLSGRGFNAATQMANMNSGASGGIGFPPGVQPMPMMYQGGMPPGMYMPAPPVMNPQQQSDEGTNGQHDGQAKTRNQRR